MAKPLSLLISALLIAACGSPAASSASADPPPDPSEEQPGAAPGRLGDAPAPGRGVSDAGRGSDASPTVLDASPADPPDASSDSPAETSSHDPDAGSDATPDATPEVDAAEAGLSSICTDYTSSQIAHPACERAGYPTAHIYIHECYELDFTAAGCLAIPVYYCCAVVPHR